jgi:hypothetical protein
MGAILVFRVLVQNIPKNKYPIITAEIVKLLDYSMNKNTKKTFWPLKFLSILVDQGHNLLEQNNLFEIFLNNNQDFFGKFSRQCQLLQSNHQITGKINTKLFMVDANTYEDINISH